jgi:hypothetical protein
MQIKIQSMPITKVLLCVVALLILANVAGIICTFVFGRPQVFGLVPMFDLNTEANVPTFFAALLHLTSSVLLLLMSVSYSNAGDQRARYWRLLALLFCFTAFDEAARIHELSMAPMRGALDLNGLLYFSWVVPAVVILAALGIYFSKFFMSLPKTLLKRMMMAAAIFIGGALIIELPEGMWYEMHGKENIVYALMTTLEESMELFGLVTFINALLLHLHERKYSLKLDF